MKKFYLKSLVFSLPFAVYFLIVLLIDPYNYFGIYKFTSDKAKSHISCKLNYPLWQLIEFKNNPHENILIGDSRMSRLKTDLIKKITGERFYNFTYGGGNIEETISTFWEAEKINKLKNVVFGINFNNFNANNIRNRVPGALVIINNPLLYLTNWNVLQSTILIAKERFLRTPSQIEKPSISKKDFWKFKLNEDSNRFYSNYKYPYSTYEKLTEIKKYCDKNGIQINFVVLPTHISLQEKIEEYGLKEENKKFLLDLRKIGKVFDFDRPTDLTMNKDNFSDPFHLRKTDQLCSKIINDIFVYKTPLYALYMSQINIDKSQD